MDHDDKVFKALADPSRRELIDRLRSKNGQTLSELCKGLEMARQSITQHLGLLEEANLISVQWRGREKFHYFNPVPIHEIYERWIRKFEQQRLEALHEFKSKLERETGMNTERFVYVTYIAANPEKIWAALLDGELTRQYWGHENVAEWKPGADWRLVADDGERTIRHVGKVLESVPNKRFALTWADPSDADDPSKHSRLVIDIEPVGEMTRLTVTHDQLTPEMQKKITAGWPRVLSSLKSFLETGRPLRTWA